MLRSIVHARNSYPLSSKYKGGSLWGKIKGFVGKAGNFLKRTKLLSTVGSVGSMFIPQLRIPTMAAHLAGYGRRRVMRRGRGRRRCR